MQEKEIETLDALRALIPPPPAVMHKRLQRTLDEYSLLIVQLATVCAVGFADSALDIEYLDLRNHPVEGAEGQTIVLPWPAGKSHTAMLAEDGFACSLYFMMPGVGFSLRANGWGSIVRTDKGVVLNFSVGALFLHCSRAKVRANFWEVREPVGTYVPEEGTELSEQALAFVAASPYLLMLTQDHAESTELSPRGDPDGFVQVLDSQTLLIPERPGNKVACSLSNILADGSVTLSLLCPGLDMVLSLAGRAWLTSDPARLAPLAIKGKPPLLAIVLEVQRYRFQRCPELLSSGLWDKATHLHDGDIPAFSKMLSEHMNGKGLLGKVTTMVVDAVVKHDLKHLY